MNREIYKKINGVWIGLIIQFMLGMVVRLYGVEPGNPDWAWELVFVKFALVAHAINGGILLIGAVMVVAAAFKSGVSLWKIAAISGLISILVASASGLVTIVFKELPNGAGPAVMAVGFVAAFASYGLFILFIQHLPKLEGKDL